MRSESGLPGSLRRSAATTTAAGSTPSGLLYPGTPEPLSFDDEGGRGPVVVEITDRGDVRFVAHDTNGGPSSPCSATPASAAPSSQ